MIYKHITELIGNTPLLRIDPSVHRLKNIDLYAKLEFYNPFGSVKDRTAWGMIKDDIQHIKEKKQTILESSSGNTAKALQAIASTFDIPFKTVTNRIRLEEVKNILQLMGAEIEQLSGKSVCFDPTDPNDPLVTIDTLIKQDKKNKYFYTGQYTNEKNITIHYETTGKEIVEDVKKVDYFFGALGSTGSTRGTAKYIKKTNPNLVTVGIVSSDDDFIPGIRNIREMGEVGLFEKEFYHAIEEIDSQKAISGMLTLIKRSGILAGPTSGASYEGVRQYLKKIDKKLSEKKVAVFIVCDRFEYYISYIKDRKPAIFQKKIVTNSFAAFPKDKFQNVPYLKNRDAEEWITKNKPLIIDIRSNLSFKTGHIAMSINIPQEQLDTILNTGIPFSKNMTILFICPVGEQSKRYAAYLKENMYEAVTLEGGIIKWRDSGKPLEKSISPNSL